MLQEELLGPVLERFGLTLKRGDDYVVPGRITEQTIRDLLESRLVIADISGLNANVLYELGIVHSFNRPVLTIVDDASSLPFDVRDERVIEVQDDSIPAERKAREIESALARMLEDDYEPQSAVRAASGSRPHAGASGDTISRSMERLILARPKHAPFDESLKDCSTVWIAAKGLKAFLNSYSRMIAEAIRNGTEFRFLIHDPADDGLMQGLAANSFNNTNPGRVREQLLTAVDEVRDLRNMSDSRRVQMRGTSWPMFNGYTFYNPEGLGKVYIEYFGYKISLNERLAVTLEASEAPLLFKFHRERFSAQWDDSRNLLS